MTIGHYQVQIVQAISMNRVRCSRHYAMDRQSADGERALFGRRVDDLFCCGIIVDRMDADPSSPFCFPRSSILNIGIKPGSGYAATNQIVRFFPLFFCRVHDLANDGPKIVLVVPLGIVLLKFTHVADPPDVVAFAGLLGIVYDSFPPLPPAILIASRTEQLLCRPRPWYRRPRSPALVKVPERRYQVV